MKFLRFLNLVPLLFLHLFPIYGVFFLKWEITGVLFWYWFESFINILFTFLLLQLRWRNLPKESHTIQKIEKGIYIWSSILFLLYATIFFVGATIGELVGEVTRWSDYFAVWNFFAEKKLLAGIIIITSAATLWQNGLAHKKYAKKTFEEITQPLKNKLITVVLFYFIVMLQYHSSDSPDVFSEHWYLPFEITALAVTRCAIDIMTFRKKTIKPIIVKEN